ncbi:CG14506 [Drosophila busckii]|uniref:CG14506 n=2 Tax=Drosophila busckii TaxID=30019 RepID=A0A0M3QYD8_DROBS|nr:CG14506 [Drosophila busckii]
MECQQISRRTHSTQKQTRFEPYLAATTPRVVKEKSREYKKSLSLSKLKPEQHCLLYIQDLSFDIRHHELFEHFCIYGNIENVNVRQRTDNYKYATIRFAAAKSAEFALAANPHKLQHKHYYCRRAGFWRPGVPRSNKDITEHQQQQRSSSLRDRQLNDLQERCYVYEPKLQVPSSVAASGSYKQSAALLPQLSKMLLRCMRKETQAQALPPSKAPRPITTAAATFLQHQQALMSNMGQSSRFVRHCYTDVMAYRQHPRQWQELPIDYKTPVTAAEYVALRENLFPTPNNEECNNSEVIPSGIRNTHVNRIFNTIFHVVL